MTEQYERIARLIAGSVAGELSEEDRAELDRWRSASPENARLYAGLLDDARRAKAYELYLSFDSRVTFADVMARSRKQARRKTFLRMSRYAAALCIFAVAGAAVYLQLRPQCPAAVENTVWLVLPDGRTLDLGSVEEVADIGLPSGAVVDGHGALTYRAETMLMAEENFPVAEEEMIYHELVVGRQKEYRVTLPDGTRVQLNSDSRLRYPAGLRGEQRKVALAGEAFFLVARSEDTPFVVDAGLYEITVLGTEFNVSNYSDDPKSRTVLVSGEVSIRHLETGEEFRLHPDQSFVMETSGHAPHVEDVDASRYTAWKEGQFRYYEERLEVIMNMIGRCYDIEVEYKEESLKDLQISLFADRYASIDPLLQIFNEHGRINVRINKNRLHISRGR